MAPITVPYLQRSASFFSCSEFETSHVSAKYRHKDAVSSYGDAQGMF